MSAACTVMTPKDKESYITSTDRSALKLGNPPVEGRGPVSSTAAVFVELVECEMLAGNKKIK